MISGLKRNTVRLETDSGHWQEEAQKTMALLRQLLGDTAEEIRHVGSTAIPGICAKPILDIAVAVRDPEHIRSKLPLLEKHGILFRGEDLPGQLLLVQGDWKQDTRTHHIHLLPRNSPAWFDYLDFRDFLRAFPAPAQVYQAHKERLARRFPQNRKAYTAGKAPIITRLLKQARAWRLQTCARRTVPSPLGPLEIAASPHGLLYLQFLPEKTAASAGHRILDQAEAWLARYFAGEKPVPDALSLAPYGTPFQQQVWQILKKIPHGQTVTYGEIARQIAPAMSAQAVGQAAGANPIPIIIPCHRVVASGGMGGFSSGLERKLYLLAHEKNSTATPHLP